jgi:glycosyltransferase involved in cell wall biosynthesis
MGEMWKHNEIKLLSRHFSSIHVVPLAFFGNSIPKKIEEENVYYSEPLLSKYSYFLNFRDVLRLFAGRTALINLWELLYLIPKINKKKLIKFISSAKRVNVILKSDCLTELLKSDRESTILYFYWGVGAADIIPFINIDRFMKVVVRMHRFDLYENENNGYIPYRRWLMNKKILVLPCSDHGREHLLLQYPESKALIRTQRLGVLRHNFVSKASINEIIRIVSCSSITNVKQVDKMILAAEQLSIPFEWTHIGSGELFEFLKIQLKRKNLENKFKFVGEVNSELILEYLILGNFDLFINTSRSEGVPVSIMEAFSVGIPVIATDAGGTKEIVDNSVGQLLRTDFAISELTDAIVKFYHLKSEERSILKNNAFVRFNERCDMEKLTRELIDILKT